MSENTNPEVPKSYEEQLKERKEKEKNEAWLKAYEQNIKEEERKDYVNAIKLQFPIGSVVTLKSGGPKLTVDKIDDYSSNAVKIHTLFFKDNRDLTKQIFSPEVLKSELVIPKAELGDMVVEI